MVFVNAPWQAGWASIRESVADGDLRVVTQALLSRGAAQARLHMLARDVRAAATGDVYVFRAVTELTNLCRMACSYCPMRRGGIAQSSHYWLSPDELDETLENIAAYDIDTVSFQSGETPKVAPIAEIAIRKAVNRFGKKQDILLCLGKLEASDYAAMREAGATSFIMKFETADPELHLALRGEPLDLRVGHIRNLQRAGFYVGTGSIIGLPGQDIAGIARDLVFGHGLQTRMLSVSPLIPARGTPLAESPPGDLETTLNAMAVLRILSPYAIIPSVSALELLAPGGQLRGLNAGANVVTANFTPRQHADKYQIYGPERFRVPVEHALSILKSAGLRPARAGAEGQLAEPA